MQVFKSRHEMEDRGLVELDPALIRRKTLRFLYVRSHRFPQFVDYVKAIETTRYRYCEGAEVNRIITMLNTGRISADDPDFADSEQDEKAILDLIQ